MREDVINETKYFKKQSVLYQLQEWRQTYRDVLLSDEKASVQKYKLKHERVFQCRRDVSELKTLVTVWTDTTQARYNAVKGIQGRKDEE